MAAISMCTTYVMACVVYLEKPGIQHALQFVHSDVSLKVQHTLTLVGSFICAGLCCAHAGTAWVTCVAVLQAAAMSGGLPMAHHLPAPAWAWVCVSPRRGARCDDGYGIACTPDVRACVHVYMCYRMQRALL